LEQKAQLRGAALVGALILLACLFAPVAVMMFHVWQTGAQ
jgi:hypothetical protein